MIFFTGGSFLIDYELAFCYFGCISLSLCPGNSQLKLKLFQCCFALALNLQKIQ